MMIPLALRSPLTEKQEDILQLIADGLTTKEIAGKVSLEPHTVFKHVFETFPRLKATSRTHATAICIRNGWIV